MTSNNHNSTSAGFPRPHEDVVYQRCNECGRNVPETNMTLHIARYHKARQSTNTNADGVSDMEVENNNNESSSIEVVLNDETREDDGRHHEDIIITEERNSLSSSPPSAPSSSYHNNFNRQAAVYNPHTEGTGGRRGQRASMTSSSTTPASQQQHSAVQHQHGQDQEEEQWSCPRCTLFNPSTSMQCEACYYMNIDQMIRYQQRQQQQMQRMQQQRQQQQQQQQQHQRQQQQQGGTAATNTNTGNRPHVEIHEIDPRMVEAAGAATSVASWGVLGALVGGPIGALVGAGAGAAIHGISRLNNGNNSPRFTFTSISQSSDGGMRVTTNNPNLGGGFRTVTIRGGEGGEGGTNGGGMTPQDRMILQMLLMNALAQGANTDTMSYEELLRRFGVGNDRRGASEQTINSVPLTQVSEETLGQLKENQKTCNICLEEFQVGDEMRTTACAHTYHKQCLDRWLSQVGSCPICKTEITNNGNGANVTNNCNHEHHQSQHANDGHHQHNTHHHPQEHHHQQQLHQEGLRHRNNASHRM